MSVLSALSVLSDSSHDERVTYSPLFVLVF